jgi:hypothetical protein
VYWPEDHPNREASSNPRFLAQCSSQSALFCAYPVAWVNNEGRTSLDLIGYSSAEPVLFRYQRKLRAEITSVGLARVAHWLGDETEEQIGSQAGEPIF